MRAKQRDRKLAKEDFRQKLVERHLTTRERLVRTNIGETYDQKWGVSCLINALMLTKAQCLLPSILNEHIIFMNLVRIKIKKKCGFASLAVGSKIVSAPCRYVFVLTESNQG